MLSYKEIELKAKEQTESRIKCKHCGHSRLLGKRDKVICNWCGNYIFKDDETEFKYRMQEQRLKEKKYGRNI